MMNESSNPPENNASKYVRESKPESERANEALTSSLDAYFEAAMVREALPRLVDGSGKILVEESAAQYAVYEAFFREQLGIEGLLLPVGEAERTIVSNAQMVVYTDQLDQEEMLVRAKTITMDYEYAASHNPSFDPTTYEEKKKYIAYLVVGKGMEVSDPWVTFLNTYIHGPAFDFESEIDSQFIGDALEEYMRENEHKQKTRELLHGLWNIFGIDMNTLDENELSADEAQRMAAMIPIGGKIIATVITAQNEAERTITLDNVMQAANIDEATIGLVKDYIATHYPIVDTTSS